MGEHKVLDNGYLSTVETWGSDERVIESARMSTGKGFNGWGVEESCDQCDGSGTKEKSHGHGPGSLCEPCRGSGRRINVPGDEKLLRYLWENKHHTPFEMAGATFEVQAPIFVYREWHRHRVPFSYNEASARYAPLPAIDYVPTVERLMLGGGHLTKQAGSVAGAGVLTEAAARNFIGALIDHYTSAEMLYQDALSNGVPKELARLCLPVARYSKMRASANVRGWLNFLALRSDRNPGAQWEIRQFANALAVELRAQFPRTMALFDQGPR